MLSLKLNAVIKMRFIPILIVLLSGLSLCELSITFPSASESNGLSRIHEFYQPSPLVDSVASLGIHAVTDLLSGEGNVIISPVNIYSCLDILQLGANGRTKEEIDAIVGHLEDDSALDKVLSLTHGVTHASAVFFSPDIVPRSDFVQKSNTKYRTDILNVDYGQGSSATSIINSWVAEKTNGAIQEILPLDPDPGTKIVVVNALTFRGKWLHPFSPFATESGRFSIDTDNFINVPMMHLQAYLPVLRRTNYDAVGLPYKEGNLAMYIILPHKHGLGELKKVLYSFSPTDLKSFPVSAVPEMTIVQIPKFKISPKFSLRDSLRNQGMVSAFDPGLGNFTNFSEGKVDGIFISDIYHSVHFEVNEEETIAAAASAAIFTKSRYFQFQVTRPFIFVISDKSGLLLFMGAVIRPE